MLRNKKVKQLDKPISQVVVNIESQALGLFDKQMKLGVIKITKALLDDTDTGTAP